jgi:hypothetical protein
MGQEVWGEGLRSGMYPCWNETRFIVCSCPTPQKVLPVQLPLSLKLPYPEREL